MYSSPTRAAEVLEDASDHFLSAIGFALSLPAYGGLSSRRCLEVANNAGDDVSEIQVAVVACIFWSFATVIVIVFSAPFHGAVGVFTKSR